jgi:uncharacterized damage-inducible protein DinB
MNMENTFYGEFIDRAIEHLDQNTKKIKSCMAELDEQEIWLSPNGHLNSAGNLILHLCGNIRQYIISSLGGLPDTRERDSEFSTKGGLTRAELVDKLHNTLEEARSVISKADPENLLRKRIVQGMNYSGVGIIIHVTEHYSYHTGQIIFLTKLLKDVDMGFYSGVDLNKRNG